MKTTNFVLEGTQSCHLKNETLEKKNPFNIKNNKYKGYTTSQKF